MEKVVAEEDGGVQAGEDEVGVELANGGCGFEGGAELESVVELVGYLHVRKAKRRRRMGLGHGGEEG